MKTFNRALRHTGLIMVLSASAIGSSASAEVPSHYAVTVIEDEAYGDELLAGKTDRAIEQLTVKADRRFATHNNLCVAQILARDFSAARGACDVAVSLSKRRILGAEDWERNLARRDYAYALTNRGVALVLEGKRQAALRDFQRATARGHGLPEPAANLRRLEFAMSNVVAKH